MRDLNYSALWPEQASHIPSRPAPLWLRSIWQCSPALTFKARLDGKPATGASSPEIMGFHAKFRINLSEGRPLRRVARLCRKGGFQVGGGRGKASLPITSVGLYNPGFSEMPVYSGAKYGVLVELVTTPPSQGGGYGFDPRTPYIPSFEEKSYLSLGGGL